MSIPDSNPGPFQMSRDRDGIKTKIGTDSFSGPALLIQPDRPAKPGRVEPTLSPYRHTLTAEDHAHRFPGDCVLCSQ